MCANSIDMAGQCRSSDPNNNNLSPSLKGYSLRPRVSRKCDEEEDVPEAEDWQQPPPPRSKRKGKSVPLSKYRRKTANARERSRMREINEAFESLRRVIPQVDVQECAGEKLTKITTLRLAMKYISALDHALHDRDLESDCESLFSDYTLTPPDVRDLSVASPAAADLFRPQPALPAGLPPFQTTPPPLPPLEPQFDNSSYVFDAKFLTDFT